MRITDKQQMSDLYLDGAFGNRWEAWRYTEYRDAGITLEAGLMYRGRPGVVLPRYCLMQSRDELFATVEHWVLLGCRTERIIVSRGSQADYVMGTHGQLIFPVEAVLHCARQAVHLVHQRMNPQLFQLRF